MRVLFIANIHAGLYKEIEAEMIKQGYEVFVMMDRYISRDPRIIKGIVGLIKYVFWKRNIRRYWEVLFDRIHDLRVPFDIVFVLSGVSVTEYPIKLLKRINPNIRVICYTWDSCDHYPFDRHLAYADKAYTFDIQDSLKNEKWKLLPIYYKRGDHNPAQSIDNKQYDLFLVGSNHDGRYPFVKKLLPQLIENNISYYIRIFAEQPKDSFPQRLFGTKEWLINSGYREEIRFSKGKENVELLIRDILPFEEYNSKQEASLCVLDDQRTGQSGLTARFIWALAAKKKVITTNEWALDYDFVSNKQVAIISKEHPILPVDFLKREMSEEDYSNVSCLEISEWLREILS